MATQYHTSKNFGTPEECRIAITTHILKTIVTLACQFLFTFVCILLTTFVPMIYNFIVKYFLLVIGLGIAGSLLSIMFIVFSTHKSIVQLALFTFFETLIVCAGSIIYGDNTIVLGLLATIGLTSGLSSYALTTKNDHTGMGPMLLTALTSLCVMGFINLFLRAPLIHVIGMYFGIMLFSGYIIYDVQIYLTEKCKTEALMHDDLYIDAALNIYLDVLNILIRIWDLIAMVTGEEKKIRQK